MTRLAKVVLSVKDLSGIYGQLTTEERTSVKVATTVVFSLGFLIGLLI